MVESRSEHTLRHEISEGGGLFKPEYVELMKEAAKHFNAQDLRMEIVGEEKGYLRVKLLKGPNMSDLAAFWNKIKALELEQKLKSMRLLKHKQ